MGIILSSVLAEIAVVLVTSFIWIYLSFSSSFQYWKRRGIHYIQPTSIFGNLDGLIFQTESYWECIKRAYDNSKNHPVVGLFSGRSPFLVIRDLELVRRVLVKDAHVFIDRPIDSPEDEDPLFSRSLFFMNGKKWRHLRIKLTPTFTSGKIKNMFPLINECGKQLLPCIDQEMLKGNCAVKDTVARYSTDVIASCAFGINVNALADPNCEFRANVRKIFEKTKAQNFFSSLALALPWLSSILVGQAIDDSVNTYVRRTFWDVVNHRNNNNVGIKDFVDIMMHIMKDGEVRAENEKDIEEIKQDSKYMSTDNSKADKLDIKLDNDDFVAQAFTFIAAGIETSSSVISFTLYELALNPVIQDKLRREIQAVLNKHKSEVTYEAIAEMSYLEMVVSETMRMHPTLPALDRMCVQDYTIPGTDITIEKDTPVVVPVLGIHMDPDIYPQPDIFDPERFSPENKSGRSKFSHMPFGEGPRICIGMRFGQMQVKTALVHILASYIVKPCAETPQPPLDMDPTAGVNVPRKNIVLAFQRIK